MNTCNIQSLKPDEHPYLLISVAYTPNLKHQGEEQVEMEFARISQCISLEYFK